MSSQLVWRRSSAKASKPWVCPAMKSTSSIGSRPVRSASSCASSNSFMTPLSAATSPPTRTWQYSLAILVSPNVVQLRQHTRAVGAGLLAEDEDRVRIREIVQQDGPLADADALGQADAGRLVTHVRAVGKIVGAEAARKKLVHKRPLVRGASGGVELGLIGVVEGVELVANHGERLIPTDRHVMVGPGIVAHRLGQTSLLLQPIVAFQLQFADSVGCKELAR